MGDGGFVDPIKGKGIYYALYSGLLAARCIRHDRSYNKMIKKITSEIRIANFYRYFLFNRPFSSVLLKMLEHSPRIGERYMKLLAGKRKYRNLWF